MGTNGRRIALETQRQECLAAVDDIRSAVEPECSAFPAISRGLVALLRVRVAEIELLQQADAGSDETRRTLAVGVLRDVARWVAGIIAGAAGAWWALS